MSRRKDAERDKPGTWRPPTRRAFVAMLGAAAAAMVVRDTQPVPVEPPRQTWTGKGKPRWIGHC